MLTEKEALLATGFRDGLAVGMHFVADHQLQLAWRVNEGRVFGLRVDLELSSVSADTPAGKRGAGELLFDDDRGATKRATFEGGGLKITVGKKLVTPPKSGKSGRCRWSDDGETVFSSTRSSEVLNRWNLTTLKAQKFKCHDDPIFVAATPTLIAACNKEGVISFFDARKPKRLVCVRPTQKGWIAFDDSGAWDCSEGFTRGVELSWSDAKSTAFIPGTGFGWLELNSFPLTRIVAAKGPKTAGLLALRTSGRW